MSRNNAFALLGLALSLACGAAGGPGDSDGAGSASSSQSRSSGGNSGGACVFHGPYTMRSTLTRQYLTGGGAHQGCDHGDNGHLASIQSRDEDECTAVACASGTCVEFTCDPGDPVTGCTGTELVTYDPHLGEGVMANCEYTWTMVTDG